MRMASRGEWMTGAKLYHLIQHEMLNERAAIENESFRPYFASENFAMYICVPKTPIRLNGLTVKLYLPNL
jgi:hypothetical protein